MSLVNFLLLVNSPALSSLPSKPENPKNTRFSYILLTAIFTGLNTDDSARISCFAYCIIIIYFSALINKLNAELEI